METFDGAGWGYTDGGHEDFSSVADGHFDELVEVAVGVVVVGFACGAADLGEGKVDTKG